MDYQQMDGKNYATTTFKMFDKNSHVCALCTHYNPFKNQMDDTYVDSGYGQCRRFPPTDYLDQESKFPVVAEDCWCGEFDT